MVYSKYDGHKLLSLLFMLLAGSQFTCTSGRMIPSHRAVRRVTYQGLHRKSRVGLGKPESITRKFAFSNKSFSRSRNPHQSNGHGTDPMTMSTGWIGLKRSIHPPKSLGSISGFDHARMTAPLSGLRPFLFFLLRDRLRHLWTCVPSYISSAKGLFPQK